MFASSHIALIAYPFNDSAGLRISLDNERSGVLHLQQPGHYNNIALALFEFRAPRLHNDLPGTIAKANSLRCLKKVFEKLVFAAEC